MTGTYDYSLLDYKNIKIDIEKYLLCWVDPLFRRFFGFPQYLNKYIEFQETTPTMH